MKRFFVSIGAESDYVEHGESINRRSTYSGKVLDEHLATELGLRIGESLVAIGLGLTVTEQNDLMRSLFDELLEGGFALEQLARLKEPQ